MANKGLVLLAAAGSVAGYLAFTSRAEIQRYLRIQRMQHDPELVGVSVTPQGNEMGLSRSENQLWRERHRPGVSPAVPISSEMPDMGPADQGH